MYFVALSWGYRYALKQLQQTLKDFQEQVLVLQSFDVAEQSLREDGRLPRKLIERVKNFLKFVYGENFPQSSEKRIRLQELESYAIVFCGLSYHITDIHKLSPKQFEFVVQHITGFINTRGLIRHLYRSDIENNVGHKLNPHDKKLFQKFLEAYIHSKPLDDQDMEQPPEVAMEQPREADTSIFGARLFQVTGEIPLAAMTIGSIYKLSANQVQAIINSGEIGNWGNTLSWPIDISKYPFMIVPVTYWIAIQYSKAENQLSLE